MKSGHTGVPLEERPNLLSQGEYCKGTYVVNDDLVFTLHFYDKGKTIYRSRRNEAFVYNEDNVIND